MGKLTQDFRPGLYYTAPAGLARCWVWRRLDHAFSGKGCGLRRL